MSLAASKMNVVDACVCSSVELLGEFNTATAQQHNSADVPSVDGLPPELTEHG